MKFLFLTLCLALFAGCASVTTKSTVTATTVSNPTVGFSGINFTVPKEWELVGQDPVKANLTNANLISFESVEQLSRKSQGITPIETIVWQTTYGSISFARFFYVHGGREPRYTSEYREIAHSIVALSILDPKTTREFVKVNDNFAGIVRKPLVNQGGPEAVVSQWRIYIKPGAIVVLSYAGFQSHEEATKRDFLRILESIK